ncbi:hypothetical protein BGZ88_006331 [Linnemannia elongata]|nr:hypothetical protein BGZ88_006331 [Linnemannia elongata]
MKFQHLLVLCILLSFFVAASRPLTTPGHPSLSGKISGLEKRSDFEKRVKAIVAEQLGVPEAEIKNEALFVNDLGADDLDMVEIVMALEDEFGIEIQDEQAERLITVQHAIDYARAHEKAAGN